MRDGRQKPPRDGGGDLIDVLERVSADVLPRAEGSILVMTFPPEAEWTDADFASRVGLLLNDMKERHGFSGAIALAHGYTLQSFDRDGLARLGLQVIPKEAEGEPA